MMKPICIFCKSRNDCNLKELLNNLQFTFQAGLDNTPFDFSLKCRYFKKCNSKYYRALKEKFWEYTYSNRYANSHIEEIFLNKYIRKDEIISSFKIIKLLKKKNKEYYLIFIYNDTWPKKTPYFIYLIYTNSPFGATEQIYRVNIADLTYESKSVLMGIEAEILNYLYFNSYKKINRLIKKWKVTKRYNFIRVEDSN